MSENNQPADERTKPIAEPSVNQTPPVLQAAFDVFFLDLDRGFTEELANIKVRMQENRTKLEKEIGKARADISHCRDKLKEICSGIDAKATSTEDQAQKMVTTIEGQMTLIFRRVRPAVDRELRPFSPRREPVAGSLRRMRESYLKSAQKLPGRPDRVEEPDPEGAGIEGPSNQVKDKLIQLSRVVRRKAEKNLILTPGQMAEEFLSALPAPEQSRLVQHYRKAYEETQTRLSDSWRGLRFHLEIALDDLHTIQDTDLAESGDVKALKASLQQTCTQTTDVFNDADAKLATCLQPMISYLDSLEERLKQKHRELVDSLRDTLEEMDTFGKVSRHTLRWIVSRARKLIQEGRVRIAQGREEVSLSAGSSLAQTGTLLKGLRSLLGRSGATSETLLDLADLPTIGTVFDQVGELPSLYRRLFTLGPLKNREFMVAREEELEDLEEVLKRWEQGKACSVALVGPEGSGKTSLINCFESEFGNRGQVLRTEFRERLHSEDDLLRYFSALLGCVDELNDHEALVQQLLAGPRRLVIVEGGHFLALREVGGLPPIKALLRLMMATHRHCLWLVSFRKYPWQRLDYQLGISRYFTHQVRTLFHDQDELREAIMLRHRTAGPPLSFLGEEPVTSEEIHKANETRFFRNLFEVTSGNLDAAIYYWLISLKAQGESKALTIAPMGRPDLGFLRALEHDYLFALAEIVGNGGLSVEEYGRIFRCSNNSSRMTLDYLVHLSLVKIEQGKEKGSTYYSLNPIFFGPVTRVLETMNILY